MLIVKAFKSSAETNQLWQAKTGIGLLVVSPAEVFMYAFEV